MSIQSNDKKLFKKLREIWNKIIELTGTSNTKDFVKNTIDDDAYEFIMAQIYKDRSFVEGNYRDKLIIFLHSVADDYVQALSVQYRC